MVLRTIKTHNLTSCRLYFGRYTLKELNSKIFKEKHVELKGCGVRSYSELTGSFLLPLRLVTRVKFSPKNIQYISNKSLANLIIRHGLVAYLTENNLINRALSYEEKLDEIFLNQKIRGLSLRLNLNPLEVLDGFLQLYYKKKPKKTSESEHFMHCFETMVQRVEGFLEEPQKIQLCA